MMKEIKRMMLLVLMAAWTTTSMGGQADVLIGNFYYSAPNGIAFIKSDEVALVHAGKYGQLAAACRVDVHLALPLVAS